MKHTKGAIKAAEVITGGTYGESLKYPTEYGRKTVEGVADIIDRKTAAPDLLEALKLLVGLIENNTLVRDISHDGDADWAVKQLPLIMALKTVQKAIAKANGKED